MCVAALPLLARLLACFFLPSYLEIVAYTHRVHVATRLGKVRSDGCGVYDVHTTVKMVVPATSIPRRGSGAGGGADTSPAGTCVCARTALYAFLPSLCSASWQALHTVRPPLSAFFPPPPLLSVAVAS